MSSGAIASSTPRLPVVPLALGATGAAGLGLLTGVVQHPTQVLVLAAGLVTGLALLGYREAAASVLLALTPSTQFLLAAVGGLSTLLYFGVLVLAVIVPRPGGIVRAANDPWYIVRVAVGVFLAALTLATLTSVDVLQSMRSLVRYGAPVGVYILVRRAAASPAGAARVEAAIGLSAALPLTVGLVQMAIGGERAEALGTDAGGGLTVYAWRRFQATFEHPNAFAGYLAVILPFLIALWRVEPRAERRAFWLALASLAIAELLWGRVRSAWAGALIGALAVLTLRRRFGLLALVLLATIVLAQTPFVQARIADLFATPVETLLSRDATEFGSDNSLHGRIWLWIGAWPLIVAEPVWGWGPGVWYSQLAVIRLAGFSLHSDYVHAMVETGAVGLAAFGLLRIALVGSTLALVRRPDVGSRVMPLSSAALATVVTVSALGLTESIFFGYSLVEWYVWAVVAVAHAAAEADRRQVHA